MDDRRLAIIEEKLKRNREELASARKEVTSKTVLAITTALALVSALFWQTAITDTIKYFIPTGGAWPYELGVALLVTTFSASAIYLLTKAQSR